MEARLGAGSSVGKRLNGSAAGREADIDTPDTADGTFSDASRLSGATVKLDRDEDEGATEDEAEEDEALIRRSRERLMALRELGLSGMGIGVDGGENNISCLGGMEIGGIAREKEPETEAEAEAEAGEEAREAEADPEEARGGDESGEGVLGVRSMAACIMSETSLGVTGFSVSSLDRAMGSSERRRDRGRFTRPSRLRPRSDSEVCLVKLGGLSSIFKSCFVGSGSDIMAASNDESEPDGEPTEAPGECTWAARFDSRPSGESARSANDGDSVAERRILGGPNGSEI